MLKTGELQRKTIVMKLVVLETTYSGSLTDLPSKSRNLTSVWQTFLANLDLDDFHVVPIIRQGPGIKNGLLSAIDGSACNYVMDHR